MTDDDLMLECRRGSTDALGRLFDRYRTPIWGFYRRRVSDRAAAEDLLQETFVVLLHGAHKYEARGAFRSYLFAIAYRLLAGHRRQHAGSASDDGLDRAEAPRADVDTVLHVRQAIAALDGMDREVVMLREFDALSYAEIGDVLGIPVNTVRSRLFRAREALKERLQ